MVCAYTRPRYQGSVYRTIGHLVLKSVLLAILHLLSDILLVSRNHLFASDENSYRGCGNDFRLLVEHRCQILQTEKPEPPLLLVTPPCAIIISFYKPGTLSLSSFIYRVTMGCLLGSSLSPRKTQSSGKGKSISICCISANCCTSWYVEDLQICWTITETTT